MARNKIPDIIDAVDADTKDVIEAFAETRDPRGRPVNDDIITRRYKVASLIAKGVKVPAIAKKLGVKDATIRSDKNAIRKAWKKDFDRNAETARAMFDRKLSDDEVAIRTQMAAVLQPSKDAGRVATSTELRTWNMLNFTLLNFLKERMKTAGITEQNIDQSQNNRTVHFTAYNFEQPQLDGDEGVIDVQTLLEKAANATPDRSVPAKS